MGSKRSVQSSLSTISETVFVRFLRHNIIQVAFSSACNQLFTIVDMIVASFCVANGVSENPVTT